MSGKPSRQNMFRVKKILHAAAAWTSVLQQVHVYTGGGEQRPFQPFYDYNFFWLQGLVEDS